MNLRCPVCRRAAIPTMNGNILRHTDTLGEEICPMSGEPYRLAELGKIARCLVPTRRRKQPRRRQSVAA